MLNNLLSAFAYWFQKEDRIGWFDESWTVWVWWVLIALAAVLLLIIIILFFKAIIRTRQRRIIRENLEKVKEAKRAEERAARKEQKAAEKARKRAEKEEQRKQKKSKTVEDEQKTEAPVVAVVAPVVEQPVVEVKQEKEERTLQGICVDTGIVKRHFEVGDEFKCDGLIVKAYYNLAPITDSVVGYAIVDDIEYNRLSDSEKHAGAYVLRPSLNEAGTKFVVVKYEDCTTVYTISVKPSENGSIVRTVEVPVEKLVEVPVETVVEKVVEVPVETVVEKVVEVPVEKIVEVPVEKVVEVPVEKIVEKIVEVPVEKVVEVPAQQAEVERTLLYVTLVTDKVQKDYILGDNLNHEGLIMLGHYNCEPYLEQLTSFNVVAPDMSRLGQFTVSVQYQDKSAGYQINVLEPPVVEEKKPEPQPVVVEKVVEKVVEVPVEKVVEKVVEPKVVETVVINEETYEAGRLRYDKSFEAKFIQADDETKHWYTEIKNTLLSYKTCKGRISWKRETFKANKEVVAKLVFRGNTLCLFVPLKVEDFADNKEVEDASNLPVYEDTPVMIRIKNEKRKRIAITLIERVMMERGILHGAHKDEDFYLPYEGVVELINKGLIKREIKTVEDEAIFVRDKEEE